MRKIYLLGLVVLMTMVLTACCGPWCQKRQQQTCAENCRLNHCCKMEMPQQKGCCKLGKQSAMPPTAAAERADVLYACDCGNGCSCNSLSKEPGNCACGKPLRWYHVVKVEQDEALLCGCEKGCNCKLDAQDPAKCACGKPIKRVSLKGSGLYFCNCGGSCTCNTVKTVPGECRCGMQLKQH